MVGCLIAVTALIPIVGAFIGCIVGAFMLLMVSPMQEMAKMKEMNPELTAPNTRMVAEMVLDTTLPTPVVRKLGFLWGILAPLFAGAALAFVLNVPMSALERRLFPHAG